MIELLHTDCMEYMKGLDDNAFEFVGCELDQDYYNAATERFNNETKQKDMF